MLHPDTSWLALVSTWLLLAFSPAAAADTGRELLWQTNSAGEDVHVIDVATNTVVKRVVVGPEPHGIAAPDDAHVVYIALEAFKFPEGELVWVDPRSYEVRHRLKIGKQPNQLACTPDGKWVYVPCDDGNYWVVDGEARKVVKKIETGGRPHNTQCSRDGRWMYLSPMGAPRRVTIVDVRAGHEVAGHIPFSDSVRPPALAADNKLLFQDVDNLIGFEVADIEARKVVARIEHRLPDELKAKPSRCHGLALRPGGKEVWCCDVDHQLVHVHDITKPDYPQLAAIPMLGRVYWLCFSPDGSRAYIAVRSERKTCVVDAETKKVVTHIEVGDTPKRNLVITLADGAPPKPR